MTRIFSRAALAALALALASPAFAQQADPAPVAQQRAARGADWTLDDYLARQRATAERRFRRLDANGDGVMSAEERRRPRRAAARAED